MEKKTKYLAKNLDKYIKNNLQYLLKARLKNDFSVPEVVFKRVNFTNSRWEWNLNEHCKNTSRYLRRPLYAELENWDVKIYQADCLDGRMPSLVKGIAGKRLI